MVVIIVCLNITDITIITVKNADYRCVIHSISKYEAINLLKNSVLGDRGYIYKYCPNFQFIKDSFFCLFCLIYIKWLTVWTSISL